MEKFQPAVAATNVLLQLLLLLALMGMAACAREAGPEIPEMRFSVDPERLGDQMSIDEGGIVFHPPANWLPLSPEALDSLQELTDISPDTAFLRPMYVFRDPEQGSVLSVARLRSAPDVAFDAHVAAYAEKLSAVFPDDSLRSTQFMKDGIHIVQYLMQPKGLVNFRLLFEAGAGTLLQFDYVVPRRHYPEQIRAVESSIGSIRRIQ